jgi:hypothetical protein
VLHHVKNIHYLLHAEAAWVKSCLTQAPCLLLQKEQKNHMQHILKTLDNVQQSLYSLNPYFMPFVLRRDFTGDSYDSNEPKSSFERWPTFRR